MGTFHSGLGALHGMTVVAKLGGGRVAVGRCHEADERRVLLLDADLYDPAKDEGDAAEFLRRAYEVGVFGRLPRVVFPTDDVMSLTLLAEHGVTSE